MSPALWPASLEGLYVLHGKFTVTVTAERE